jgi:hypothetical protein
MWGGFLDAPKQLFTGWSGRTRRVVPEQDRYVLLHTELRDLSIRQDHHLLHEDVPDRRLVPVDPFQITLFRSDPPVVEVVQGEGPGRASPLQEVEPEEHRRLDRIVARVFLVSEDRRNLVVDETWKLRHETRLEDRHVRGLQGRRQPNVDRHGLPRPVGPKRECLLRERAREHRTRSRSVVPRRNKVLCLLVFGGPDSYCSGNVRDRNKHPPTTFSPLHVDGIIDVAGRLRVEGETSYLGT